MSSPLRLPLVALSEGERELPEDTSRYVCRVHRLTPGSSLTVFDPVAALEADALLLHAGQRARVQVGAPRPASRLPRRPVTLLQALGKGDKPESVVDAATVLGVTRLVFVQSQRSVVRWDERRGEGRLERWRRVAVAAARQSGRGDLPELLGPVSLDDAAQLVPEAARRVVLSPGAPRRLAAVVGGARDVALAIGPEGGLSEPETQQLERHGFQPASFGELVLRTETATVAALGALMALEGEPASTAAQSR